MTALTRTNEDEVTKIDTISRTLATTFDGPIAIKVVKNINFCAASSFTDEAGKNVDIAEHFQFGLPLAKRNDDNATRYLNFNLYGKTITPKDAGRMVVMNNVEIWEKEIELTVKNKDGQNFNVRETHYTIDCHRSSEQCAVPLKLKLALNTFLPKDGNKWICVDGQKRAFITTVEQKVYTHTCSVCKTTETSYRPSRFETHLCHACISDGKTAPSRIPPTPTDQQQVDNMLMQ